MSFESKRRSFGAPALAPPPLRGPKGDKGAQGPVGTGGGGIPPGSYDGQPVAWNGASWAPAVVLKVSQIINSSFDLIVAQITEEVYRSTLYLGTYYATLSSLGSVNVVSGNGPEGGDGGGYAANGSNHSFGSYYGGSNIEILRMALPDGIPQIGFFGDAPVPRPSITGTTTQQQVDSLVAALTALGLVSDDRFP